MIHKSSAWLSLVVASSLAAASSPAQELTLHGRVRGSEAGPLAGAVVELTPALPWHTRGILHFEGAPGPPLGAVSRSAEDGSFEIAVPRPGPWRVLIRHPDHMPRATEHGLLPLLVSRTLPEVTLAPKQHRRVRVLRGGRPVSGLDLAVTGRVPEGQAAAGRGWYRPTDHIQTSESGWARLPQGPEETLIVWAAAADDYLFQELEPSSEATDLRLAASWSATRIVDAQGRPAAGVAAFVQTPFVAFGTTGEDGRIGLPMGSDPAPFALAGARGFYDLGTTDQEGDTWVLPLASTRWLTGRVVDAENGQPIARGWITRGSECWSTDPDGSYRMRQRDPSVVETWISASGYVPMKLRLDLQRLEGSEIPRVELVPASERMVRIVDPRGDALEAASVRIAEWARRVRHERPWGFLETADWAGTLRLGDGRFRLELLRPDHSYRLRVTCAGFAERSITLPPSAPGGPAPGEAVITLQRGLEVFGRVLDAEDRPLAGARVILIAGDPRGPFAGEFSTFAKGQEALADADGRFAIAELAAGTFSLLVDADGFLSAITTGIEVRPRPEPIDLGSVRLEPAAVLRGQVTDAAGAGLEGVKLAATAAGQPGESATTDQEGHFALDIVPGEAVDLTITKSGYLERTDRGIDPPAGEPRQIVLESAASLRGQMADSRGLSLWRGIAVSLSRDDGGETDTAWTDAEGRFEFRDQQPGQARLRVGAEELAVELEAGVANQAVLFQIPTTAELRGRVLDPEEAALRGAGTTLTSLGADTSKLLERGHVASAATSGDDGRFLIRALAGGRYRLRLEHPDFAPAEELIELEDGGEKTVEVSFQRRRSAARISGRVVDASGSPVAGASLRLFDAADQPASAFIHSLGQAESFFDGSFEIEADEPGRYVLEVKYDGFAYRRTDPFSLGSAGRSEMVVSLDPGATASGRIFGLTERELARVKVQAMLQDFTGLVNGHVSPGGSYRVPHLALGEWTLTAQLPGAEAHTRKQSINHELEVRSPDELLTHDFRFAPGFRVHGRVLRAGEPVSANELSIRCRSSGTFLTTRTGAQGELDFHGVPKGLCRLSLPAPGSEVKLQHRLKVTGDMELELDIADGSWGEGSPANEMLRWGEWLWSWKWAILAALLLVLVLPIWGIWRALSKS